jgi:hypothetical protein
VLGGKMKNGRLAVLMVGIGLVGGLGIGFTAGTAYGVNRERAAQALRSTPPVAETIQKEDKIPFNGGKGVVTSIRVERVPKSL